MRVVLAQVKIIWENREANLQKAEEILRRCDKSADLVLFPEMSFTGFSAKVMKHGEEHEETLCAMRKIIEKGHLTVGFGWAKQVDGRCRNHYTIMRQNGEILTDYAKIHPFSYAREERYVEGGDFFSFAEFEGFTLGNTICYDLRFPELYSALSKRADFIVVPANWPASRIDQWNCLLQARAIENQCYMAGINCVGDIGGIFYNGHSMLFNPKGEELKPEILWVNNADGEWERLLCYDIENESKNFRGFFSSKRDRREDLYKKFWDELNL